MIHVIATIEVKPGTGDAYLAAPHMAAYREAVRDYVAGAQLQILEPA